MGGLIADAKAIEDELLSTDERIAPLEKENERLKEELEEAKRPFTAQMTMQNRRIIALNERILELEMQLEQRK